MPKQCIIHYYLYAWLRLKFIITSKSGQSEECLSHHLQAHSNNYKVHYLEEL